MAVVDIVLLTLIGLGALFGYQKGLIRVVSGFLSILIGIFASIKFSDYTKDFLIEQHWIAEQYLGIASLALTFVMVVVMIKWGASWIEGFLKTIGINFVNRFAGAFLGLCINLIILLVLVFYLYPYLQDFDSIKQSNYLPQCYGIAKKIVANI